VLSVSPSSFTLRQGDRTPAPRWRIVPAPSCCAEGEEPIDPSLYSSWSLILYGLTTVVVPLTYDATTRDLVGTWDPGSTDVAGSYLGILQAVETLTSLPRTFPTEDEVIVVVVPLPS
jgi:hypothetical protein